MASRITAAWERLYAAQTRTLADTATSDTGTRQATVGNVTGNAVIGVPAFSDDLQVDGFSQGGEYTFSMLASDFETPPAPQSAITLPGIAATLVMKDADLNNGVYHFTAIDPSKR
jgi:hypothetical protein